MSSVLEIANLCKNYPTFSLKSASFVLKKGTIMGFVGRNGAGKSTTMKSILHLVSPDAGEIRIFGKRFDEAEDEIKCRIGYASAGTNYYPRKKLSDILSLTKTFYPNWDDEICNRYMDLFALSPEKRIMDLSEGMKVKFHLVLALSHHAELLILDEPTSGLDPVSREELVVIFRELASSGVTILFSTHITSDLEKCAEYITYIKKGRILASEKTSDFLARYAEKAKTLEDIMVYLEVYEKGGEEA